MHKEDVKMRHNKKMHNAPVVQSERMDEGGVKDAGEIMTMKGDIQCRKCAYWYWSYKYLECPLCGYRLSATIDDEIFERYPWEEDW